MKTKAIKLFLLLLLLCSTLAGQEIIFEKYADGVDFRIMIPYNIINFKRDSDTAQYQVSLEIKNSDNRRVAMLEETLFLLRRDWLKDKAIPVLFQADIPPGKYKAQFSMRNPALGDKRNQEKTFTVGDTFTEIGQPYLIMQKDGISYIPSALDRISYPLDSIRIEHRFTLQADSVHIQLDDVLFSYPNPAGRISEDLSSLFNTMQPGKIAVSLFERNIRYYLEPFLYSQWFSYNMIYDAKDQMQQLRYIANQNEWRSLRAVSKAAYQEAIDSFWEVHDPSPGTIRNEARENFYQRVIIADERYTVHKRLKGWKSDRGRIYIKYGEPDDTYSEVHPVGLYPYIVWTYYNENLEFIFADTGGYGQYTLRNKDEEY